MDVSAEAWGMDKQDLQKDLEQKTKFLKKHKANEKKLQQEVDQLRNQVIYVTVYLNLPAITTCVLGNYLIKS